MEELAHPRYLIIDVLGQLVVSKLIADLLKTPYGIWNGGVGYGAHAHRHTGTVKTSLMKGL
jgi:hypothetical protein